MVLGGLRKHLCCCNSWIEIGLTCNSSCGGLIQEVLPKMKRKWTVLYQKEWAAIKGESSRSVACQQVREWGGGELAFASDCRSVSALVSLHFFLCTLIFLDSCVLILNEKQLPQTVSSPQASANPHLCPDTKGPPRLGRRGFPAEEEIDAKQHGTLWFVQCWNLLTLGDVSVGQETWIHGGTHLYAQHSGDRGRQI